MGRPLFAGETHWPELGLGAPRGAKCGRSICATLSLKEPELRNSDAIAWNDLGVREEAHELVDGLV